jgi:glycine reductase
MSKELEKAGLPVALISAMFPVAQQVRAARIVKGVSIPHPCGDPNLPRELDAKLRQQIVQAALDALQTEVSEPTLFAPKLA